MRGRARIRQNILTDEAAKAGKKPFPFQIKKALAIRQLLIDFDQPVAETEQQIMAMNQVEIQLFFNRCNSILFNLKQRR